MYGAENKELDRRLEELETLQADLTASQTQNAMLREALEIARHATDKLNVQEMIERVLNATSTGGRATQDTNKYRAPLTVSEAQMGAETRVIAAAKAWTTRRQDDTWADAECELYDSVKALEEANND